MKLIILAALIVVGILGWNIGSLLSPDAVAMAVGVLFGVLAGLPVALLVLASSRRKEEVTQTITVPYDVIN